MDYFYADELAAAIMMDCYNTKSFRDKVFSYMVFQGNNNNLSSEREKWQSDTDAVIERFRSSRPDQFRAIVKNQPVAVQHFLFERFIVAINAKWIREEYSGVFGIPSLYGETIAPILQDAWYKNCSLLEEHGVDLDLYIKQLLHKH